MCLGHRLAGALAGAGVASLAFGPVHQWDFVVFALTLIAVGLWSGRGARRDAGAHRRPPAAARIG